MVIHRRYALSACIFFPPLGFGVVIFRLFYFVGRHVAKAWQQPQQPQAAPTDVAEQIKKLGELRDQGLLTEQEFNSKKQELLARM
jgi:hypothetical protein